MEGLNRAYLIGRIGHEPEMRVDVDGTPLVLLSLATPASRTEGDVRVESQDWHRLLFTAKNAELVVKHAHKGDTLAVECILRQEREEAEGVARYRIELVVERVLWLSAGAVAEAP